MGTSDEEWADEYKDDNDSFQAQTPKRRKYTQVEDNKILEFLVANKNTPTRQCMQKLVDEHVIDRTFLSAQERLREVLIPNLKNGDLENTEALELFKHHTYSPKTSKRQLKSGRSIVKESDTLKLVQYLIAFEGPVYPTSEQFWERAMVTKNLEIPDTHSSHLVAVYRNHIRKKVDTLALSQEQKESLYNKLPGLRTTPSNQTQNTSLKTTAPLHSNNGILKKEDDSTQEFREQRACSNEQADAVASVKNVADKSESNTIQSSPSDPCEYEDHNQSLPVVLEGQESSAITREKEHKLSKLEETAVAVAKKIFEKSKQSTGPDRITCVLAIDQIMWLKRVADAAKIAQKDLEKQSGV